MIRGGGGGGGLSLQTLSSEERLRHAPFLTVLGERDRESERASERAREREREREKERESERERAWYPRAGAVCSAVVAHCTISQVRPAHHTVILESLQRRAFYPCPRRPHVAFRPRSSSAHPDAHHPRPASIRPPTLLPPPRTPTRCRARRKPSNAGLDAAAPSPRPRKDYAHPTVRHP